MWEWRLYGRWVSPTLNPVHHKEGGTFLLRPGVVSRFVAGLPPGEKLFRPFGNIESSCCRLGEFELIGTRKDGKRVEKDGKRTRKYAETAPGYRYSMHTEADFGKKVGGVRVFLPGSGDGCAWS